MTVRELYQKLDERIPRSLSFSWDNDGLMCCPDGAREVKRVLVALDVTGEVTEIAIEGGYDVILSHHPFIFKGLKALDDEGAISAKAIRLLQNNISVMSFHTRLDCAEGGVNDKLCELLDLGYVEDMLEDGLPLGRIGNFDVPMSATEFAATVKEVLDAPCVLLADAGAEVRRVAVCGGSGGDLLNTARKMGADTFVSGRVGYHEMTDAPDFCEKLNIIEAGHFYTEHPVCEVLLDLVCEIDPEIECDICNSNCIKVI